MAIFYARSFSVCAEEKIIKIQVHRVKSVKEE